MGITESINGSKRMDYMGQIIVGSAHADLRKFDDAWRCIDEAMATIKTTNERWFEAEANRIAGEIALKSRMASESSSTAQPPTSHPALRYASRGEHLTGDRGVVAAHSTTSLCLVRMCLRSHPRRGHGGHYREQRLGTTTRMEVLTTDKAAYCV
jgi:hypothetical protein